MDLITTDIEFATPEYQATIDLRTEILRIPLGLEFTPEQLAEEYDSYHIGIYTYELDLLGCLVLKPIDEAETVKMRQVAVKASHQNNGIGKKLVLYSELFAKRKGFKKMVLNARDVAIPFYEKLNYKKVGKQFEEVGIPHFKMEKAL